MDAAHLERQASFGLDKDTVNPWPLSPPVRVRDLLLDLPSVTDADLGSSFDSVLSVSSNETCMDSPRTSEFSSSSLLDVGPLMERDFSLDTLPNRYVSASCISQEFQNFPVLTTCPDDIASGGSLSASSSVPYLVTAENQELKSTPPTPVTDLTAALAAKDQELKGVKALLAQANRARLAEAKSSKQMLINAQRTIDVMKLKLEQRNKLIRSLLGREGIEDREEMSPTSDHSSGFWGEDFQQNEPVDVPKGSPRIKRGDEALCMSYVNSPAGSSRRTKPVPREGETVASVRNAPSRNKPMGGGALIAKSWSLPQAHRSLSQTSQSLPQKLGRMSHATSFSSLRGFDAASSRCVTTAPLVRLSTGCVKSSSSQNSPKKIDVESLALLQSVWELASKPTSSGGQSRQDDPTQSRAQGSRERLFPPRSPSDPVLEALIIEDDNGEMDGIEPESPMSVMSYKESLSPRKPCVLPSRCSSAEELSSEEDRKHSLSTQAKLARLRQIDGMLVVDRSDVQCSTRGHGFPSSSSFPPSSPSSSSSSSASTLEPQPLSRKPVFQFPNSTTNSSPQVLCSSPRFQRPVHIFTRRSTSSSSIGSVASNVSGNSRSPFEFSRDSQLSSSAPQSSRSLYEECEDDESFSPVRFCKGTTISEMPSALHAVLPDDATANGDPRILTTTSTPRTTAAQETDTSSTESDGVEQHIVCLPPELTPRTNMEDCLSSNLPCATSKNITRFSQININVEAEAGAGNTKRESTVPSLRSKELLVRGKFSRLRLSSKRGYSNQ
eukprot:gb/GEZN01001826.1/.p1 GENE.gb/GEZN01001826.1/~~gb/GEZN01001826.1/.p1  ORF type:complete len:780 (-),score=114.37 gb/GEZN01001826.1/:373-2712(-)